MSEPGDLADRRCVPCHAGTPRIGDAEARALLACLDGWELVDGRRLRREFRFRNFRDALAFVNEVGEIAEAEDHHPELLLAWGRVRVEIWTHAIDGLSANDFVLAAKLDRLASAS